MVKSRPGSIISRELLVDEVGYVSLEAPRPQLVSWDETGHGDLDKLAVLSSPYIGRPLYL
jgi:hypothetical protein